MYFPPGTYLIASFGGASSPSSALAPRSNVTLFGDGDASVLKPKNNVNTYGAEPEDDTDFDLIKGPASNCVFRDLKFDMNGANNLVPNGRRSLLTAIWITGGSSIVMESITNVNASGGRVLAVGNGTPDSQSASSFETAGSAPSPTRFRIRTSVIIRRSTSRAIAF